MCISFLELFSSPQIKVLNSTPLMRKFRKSKNIKSQRIFEKSQKKIQVEVIAIVELIIENHPFIPF